MPAVATETILIDLTEFEGQETEVVVDIAEMRREYEKFGEKMDDETALSAGSVHLYNEGGSKPTRIVEVPGKEKLWKEHGIALHCAVSISS